MNINSTTISLLLLSVGLFYTFTNVQYQEVKDLNSIAGRYQDVLQDAEDIIELRDKLLVAFETIPEAQIDRISKALPDNVDTVRLAFDLDGIASRYGISIKDLKTVMKGDSSTAVVLPEAAGAYEKATITFAFVATYENFMRFLADIERNLRVMNVNLIQFRSTDSGLYEYTMSVETYWLK